MCPYHFMLTFHIDRLTSRSWERIGVCVISISLDILYLAGIPQLYTLFRNFFQIKICSSSSREKLNHKTAHIIPYIIMSQIRHIPHSTLWVGLRNADLIEAPVTVYYRCYSSDSACRETYSAYVSLPEMRKQEHKYTYHCSNHPTLRTTKTCVQSKHKLSKTNQWWKKY